MGRLVLLKKQLVIMIVILSATVWIVACDIPNRKINEIETTPVFVKIDPTIQSDQILIPTRTIIKNESSTPMLTLTPLPKEENKKEIIENYLQLNGGCDLPCWWGVYPGQSAWDEITQRFDSLSEQSNYQTDKIQLDDFEVIEEIKGYLYSENDKTIRWTIYGVNNKVSEISVSTNFKNQFNYSEIFKDIGVPEKIYITTLANVPGYPTLDPYLPFNVVIQYVEKNIIIWHQMQGQKIGDKIIACSQDYYMHIWIWSDEYGGDLVEKYALNASGGGNDGAQYLKTVEDVTDMTIESFVETFTNNPNACISTPAENW